MAKLSPRVNRNQQSTRLRRLSQSFLQVGSEIVIGSSPVTGGSSGSVLFVSSAGTISQDNANFFWDDNNNRLGIGGGTGTTTPSAVLDVRPDSATEKGIVVRGTTSHSANLQEWQDVSNTAYITIGPPTLTGSDINNNFFNITATLPTTLTAETSAVRWVIGTAGSSSQTINGMRCVLQLGYTGNKQTNCFDFENLVAGTGSGGHFNGLYDGNHGIQGSVNANTTGTNVGVIAYARLGAINIGGIFITDQTKAGASNVGLGGVAIDPGGGGTMTGGYFKLGTGGFGFNSSAIVCDNGTETVPIILALDNGTEVFSVRDTGIIVINESGASTADVRIEGDTDQNLFFSDASTDSIGIGKASPSVKFDVEGVIGTKAGLSSGVAKVGGGIFDYFTDSTVGGAETDIFTNTILANTLGSNADKLSASYAGNFVTVGTEVVQLKVYFAGTAIWDSTGIAVTTGTTSWIVYVEIIRVSSTVIRFNVSLSTTGASGFVYDTCGELTGLTLSSGNILKITGTSSGVGSGSGDIVGKMGYVEFKPAA